MQWARFSCALGSFAGTAGPFFGRVEGVESCCFLVPCLWGLCRFVGGRAIHLGFGDVTSLNSSWKSSSTHVCYVIRLILVPQCSLDVFNMFTHESGFKTSFFEVGSNMCALATTHESSFSWWLGSLPRGGVEKKSHVMSCHVITWKGEPYGWRLKVLIWVERLLFTCCTLLYTAAPFSLFARRVNLWWSFPLRRGSWDLNHFEGCFMLTWTPSRIPVYYEKSLIWCSIFLRREKCAHGLGIENCMFIKGPNLPCSWGKICFERILLMVKYLQSKGMAMHLATILEDWSGVMSIVQSWGSNFLTPEALSLSSWARSMRPCWSTRLKKQLGCPNSWTQLCSWVVRTLWEAIL